MEGDVQEELIELAVVKQKSPEMTVEHEDAEPVQKFELQDDFNGEGS